MRKKFLIPLLLLLTACTEDIDLRSRSDYHDYLTVEATLNDRPEDVQQVILSRSISYFNDEPQPMVSGASVGARARACSISLQTLGSGTSSLTIG